GDEAKLQVLADIKTVFEESIHASVIARDGAVHSEKLVEALVDLEGSRWADFSRGKPLTQNGLAHLLDEYGINPQRMRIGKDNKNGYRVDWFDDAFASYLPTCLPGGNELEQLEQPCNHRGISAHELEHEPEQELEQKPEQAAESVPETVPVGVPADVPVGEDE